MILPKGAKATRVATGTVWGEGPVWLPAEQVVRWSDIPNNRILEYDPASGETRVHRDDVEFTNGRTLDLDGRVIQCSHGRRAVEREDDAEPTVIVDAWNGVRLNSPNDVVVKSDRTIWFTDPGYGIDNAAEGHPGEHEYGDHYVFQFDEGSGVIRPVVIDIADPNGLAFSPDESLLYVSDTSDAARRRVTPSIRVYDVVDGRACKNGRAFASVHRGLVDGFRVDETGNLWASSADAVVVFGPDGRELTRVPVPEPIANLCFGGPDGRDLYITATTSLYLLRTSVRDAAWRGDA